MLCFTAMRLRDHFVDRFGKAPYFIYMSSVVLEGGVEKCMGHFALITRGGERVEDGLGPPAAARFHQHLRKLCAAGGVHTAHARAAQVRALCRAAGSAESDAAQSAADLHCRESKPACMPRGECSKFV